MLRMVQLRSADEAKRYYQGAAKSRGDYYAEQELTGRWGGDGASRLGLKGQVEREQFELLCDNLHPVTGEQLTARTRDDRTVGYDLSFHCPKSVSSVLAVTGDQDLIAAFRESVDETMREIELQAETRVRLDRRDDNRETGNLVWAEFVHHTARPVAGTPDPHLHSHCVVFNATWDKVESRWKAGQFRGIKRDAPYFEAAFHARMANRVRELGYAIRRTSNRVGGWEIVGVPPAVLDRFSRRTEEIEKLASELGVTDPEKKSELGARTRRGKARDQSMSDLRREWDSRLTDPERESIRSCRGRSPAPPPPDGPADAGRALDHAATHLFERESVVSEKRLVGEALRFGVGSLSVGDAWKGLDHAGGKFLRGSGDGQKLVTTPEVLAEEKAMIAFARDGRGQCRPLREPGHRPPTPTPSTQLNKQQRAAVEHLWSSPDRVMLLRGGAGTGKTTLMREAIGGIEASGKKVFTFAPTSDAARRVLREEAGFKDADTVASLLARSRPDQPLTGNVIWVDEAGQLGTRAMHSLFQVAERYQCRVILSGDTKQHGSVERGDALRLLETQAGCRPAEVREILRQRGAYKEAVAAAERGHLDSCFGQLQKMGSVREVSPEEAHHRIARDYIAARKAGKSALVVSPTHREGERVNAAIRDSLQESGAIGQEERKFTRLVILSLTEGERSDWRRYESGQVVQFVQHAPGFRRGERLTVESVGEDGQVEARDGEGGLRSVPLDQAKRFQLYRQEEISLAAGDTIRISHTGRTEDDRHWLNNGELRNVKGFTKDGDLVLDNGWIVDKGFGHFAHGYCVTSHKAQGKTVDRVLIAQSADSFVASSREQWYVSISRARESVSVYTDDAAALRQAVQRSAERRAAVEILSGSGPSDVSLHHLHVGLAYARGSTPAQVSQRTAASGPTPPLNADQLLNLLQYQKERERER